MTQSPLSDSNELWKVAKVIAASGKCSRRQAEDWLQKGWVLINGQLITNPAERVNPQSCVEFCIPPSMDKQDITILYNKPLGVLSCGPKQKNYSLASEKILLDNCYTKHAPSFDMNLSTQLQCAGRLDVHSKGLLILTTDVRVLRKLLNEESIMVEKEYLVKASQAITEKQFSRLRSLTHIEGIAIRPFIVQKLDHDFVKIILREGKKHQIRKMLCEVGLRAVRIKRVRVGPLSLGKLPENQWRMATQAELQRLLSL